MAAEAPLGSNNPFRKKGPAGKLAPVSTSSTVFDEIFATEAADAEPRPEPLVKPKVVKRVRVQSPPPSSPETGPNTPAGYTRGGDVEDGESSDSCESKEDPFDTVGTDDEGDQVDVTEAAETTTATLLNRPPPNPFSKTLHDLEHGSQPPAEELAPPTLPKGSLDVDAFRQLLLTGRTGTDAPQTPTSTAPQVSLLPPRDESSTDTSTISRQSALEPPHDHSAPTSSTDTPRTSHEIEQDGRELGRSESATPVPRRKKPPPPSSRHGKLIKIELKEQQRRSPGLISPSDVNKPLPPAPIRKPVDEESTSIFDQESVGKVPEPSPTIMAPASSPLSKKPMPAPPPRRQRSETKIPLAAGAASHEDEPPRRSSSESARSKADSGRLSYYAPAPPPPRRPHTSGTGGRLTSSFASPSGHSFTSASTSPSISASDNDRSPLGFLPAPSTSLDAPVHVGNVKLAPPPPPARNPSTRRPQSSSSMESMNKRWSVGGKEPAPPPPPRRQRGGSRGSMESADGHLPRRPSMDGPRMMPGTPVVEEPLKEVDEASVEEASLSATASPRQPTLVIEGHGEHILADLDALQREVIALQEQFAKSGGTSG